MNKKGNVFFSFALLTLLFVAQVSNGKDIAGYPVGYEIRAEKLFEVESDNVGGNRPHSIQGVDIRGNNLVVAFVHDGGTEARDSVRDDTVQIKKCKFKESIAQKRCVQNGSSHTFRVGQLGHANDVAFGRDGYLYVATMLGHSLKRVCVTADCPYPSYSWNVQDFKLQEGDDYIPNKIGWCGNMGTGRFAIGDGEQVRFYKEDGYYDPWNPVKLLATNKKREDYGKGQGMMCSGWDRNVYLLRWGVPDANGRNVIFVLDWYGNKIAANPINIPKDPNRNIKSTSEGEAIFAHDGYVYLAVNVRISEDNRTYYKDVIYRLH